MSAPRPPPPPGGARRIVVWDYNALLQSVTGLLRMSGYCVFRAYDGYAVQELCAQLPRIELLVLNTYGSGINTGDLVRLVRTVTPNLPVLHIGASMPGLPADVPSLDEPFTPEQLLQAVAEILPH